MITSGILHPRSGGPLRRKFKNFNKKCWPARTQQRTLKEPSEERSSNLQKERLRYYLCSVLFCSLPSCHVLRHSILCYANLVAKVYYTMLCYLTLYTIYTMLCCAVIFLTYSVCYAMPINVENNAMLFYSIPLHLCLLSILPVAHIKRNLIRL